MIAEQKGDSVPILILDRFQDGVVSLGAASIHLMDPGQKFQGVLGLSHNSFLDGLVPDVFLTTFLLGLGADGWL